MKSTSFNTRIKKKKNEAAIQKLCDAVAVGANDVCARARVCVCLCLSRRRATVRRVGCGAGRGRVL
jgi:hypothetical protein